MKKILLVALLLLSLILCLTVAGCTSGVDKAISNYTKAIEIYPEYASAYYNRGIVWFNKGAYGNASADFTKAIEIDRKLTNA